MGLQQAMRIIVIALDGCILNRAVHAFDLPIRPGMAYLREAMLDTVRLADPVERDGPVRFGTFPLGELNAVVGQHGMNGIGNGSNQVFQEIPGHHAGCLLVKLGIGILRGPVNGDKQVQFALFGLYFRYIDMEVANRVRPEALFLRFLPGRISQSSDAVSLQATMQG